jgi:hypothetical protein
MTTKAPSPVQPSAPGSMESVAYESVAGIPTLEPHDRDRLGYALWFWLKHRKDPLESIVRAAGVRFLISEDEAMQRIEEYLKSKGIQP